MGLTTDKDNKCLNETKDNGQQECYLVLSEEEIAKGFVRPYRDSYIHKGRHYPNGVEILDEVYKTDNGKKYIAIAPILDENEKRLGGSYLTQKEVDQFNQKDGYIGGCGTLTKMNRGISETYARDPNFYGATFCVGCGTHLPLSEFVWDGSYDLVGS